VSTGYVTVLHQGLPLFNWIDSVHSVFSRAVLSVGFGYIVAKKATPSTPTSIMLGKINGADIQWQEIHKSAQSTGFSYPNASER
jgi:hypothetical protein